MFALSVLCHAEMRNLHPKTACSLRRRSVDHAPRARFEGEKRLQVHDQVNEMLVAAAWTSVNPLLRDSTEWDPAVCSVILC